MLRSKDEYPGMRSGYPGRAGPQPLKTGLRFSWKARKPSA